MKLTKKVLAVLKNFATINSGIIIKAGSSIQTKSIEKNIFAQCDIDVEFPIEFCIFDLNEFLSTISIFNDPELEFEEKYVTINEGKSSVRYYYSSPTVVTGVTKMPSFPEGKNKFSITQDELLSLTKASNILELNTLKLCNDAAGVSLIVTDVDNSTSNQFKQHIDTSDVEDFSDEVSIEYLKMLPLDYDVEVKSGMFIHLKNDKENIRYWVSVGV